MFEFEAVFNFRDLGGLPTSAGKKTRAGVLFRSANLVDASPRDLAYLHGDLNVRTLVDLRNPEEHIQYPTRHPWPGETVRIPLLENRWLKPLPTLAEGYVYYVGQPHIGRRLAEIVAYVGTRTTPVVFACAAGKDRTGLVAAALLGTIGVPEQVIVDDYARTQDELDRLYAHFAKNPASTIRQDLATKRHLLMAPPEAMQAVLTWVAKEHGSFRSYLLAHGAKEETLKALERGLLR